MVNCVPGCAFSTPDLASVPGYVDQVKSTGKRRREGGGGGGGGGKRKTERKKTRKQGRKKPRHFCRQCFSGLACI